MTIRNRGLPPGWYPDSRALVERAVSGFLAGVARGAAAACMAPHAGWYYSGPIAAKAIAALDPQAETVVVFGGHRPARTVPLLALEDGFETPAGTVSADLELRAAVAADLPSAEDRWVDNTVEVMLPMIRVLFPASRVLWLRVAADVSSWETGKTVAAAAGRLGRRAVAVGSTDLTHYGPNYDFQPRGTGKEALEWVRTVNDAAFLRAVLAGDPGAAIARAEEDSSACSAGAAVAAMGFAAACGAVSGDLLAYGTSADVSPATSFVGYGAVAWTKPAVPAA